MQFSLIVAVLAAMVISESLPHQAVSGEALRTLAALLGIACVVVVAWVDASRTARRLTWDFSRRHAILRRFRRARQIHTALWLAVSVAILYGLRWPQIVRFNWRLEGLILVDDLLVLAPVLLPMILSWAAFYEVDRVLQTFAPLEGEKPSPPTSRGQYVTLQLRHCLGLLLLPVLGLVAVQDVAEWLMPDFVHGKYALAIYAPPLVLLFAFFPTLLRYVWHTWPLAAGNLHDRLHAAAGRAGFRCRRILVWNTNGMLVNAAVAGFLPAHRYVFLTDGLLSQLTDEEIEAVFGHEVGHIRHRHLLLRIVAMAAPVSLWFLAEQAFPQGIEHLRLLIAEGGMGLQVPMGLLLLTAMISYGLVIFGFYARLLEGQADLFGCRTLDLGENRHAVDVFVSALEKLAACSGVDRNAASWQHASIARRVAFLHRATQDPQYERRFHRWVFSLSCLLVCLAASPVVCLLTR